MFNDKIIKLPFYYNKIQKHVNIFIFKLPLYLVITRYKKHMNIYELKAILSFLYNLLQ